jgi:hypothetical protein
MPAPDYTYTMAQSADIYQSRPYYTDKYSDGKYNRIIDLKEKRRRLETMIRDYYRRYRAYNAYMETRGGDWNEFAGRNDMGGLGLSPGEQSETAGWYYLGDTETVDECKRASLRDDKMYTRVIHYTPENGYRGNWKYGCYGSVPGSKTSTNPRFNSIGVTTVDRTYWVDEPVASADVEAVLPPTGTTNPVNYKGWVYLGNYPQSANDSTNEFGLYGCKELAKNPTGPVTIKKRDGTSVAMIPAAPYAKNQAFNTVLYLDKNFPTANLRGTCYGRTGAPVASNSIFLYKVNTESTIGAGIAKGGIVWNNATQSSATVLYISKTDLQNKAFTTGLRSRGKIIIQDPAKSANYQSWTINGDPSYGETGYVSVTVASAHDPDYKFWSALNKSSVVLTITNDVAGATTSYQTRCTDNVEGDEGGQENENSGPPILKGQMAKDLRERYDAIMNFKREIDDKFQPIPEIGDELNATLDKMIFDMQTKWEPEAWFYRDKLARLESDTNTMDESDSTVFLNSVRYTYVLYAIYAALFVVGIIYIARADDDNAPSVKYVQYALFGSLLLWLAYYVIDYNKK